MMKSLFPLFFLATGCTYSVHQVQMSDFTPYQKGGKKIMVKGEQVRILDIALQTDYIEQAYQDLQAKCQGGDIVGITTEFMTHHHFFHARDYVYLKARCLRAGDDGKRAEEGTGNANSSDSSEWET